MQSTVSVIIPALNEAERLPRLFDSLDRQTCRPSEVIVADAGSTDATREVVAARGAIVVDGGKPAVGRNAGARVAGSDLLLFLDADDEIDDDFIAASVEEFEDRELAVASAFVEPIERDPENVFACEVVNLYLDVMQYVAPHAPGFCILIKRDVHEAIDGFDETVVLAEDHDYVQRAAEKGTFRILRSYRVGTSMRRIEKEGLVRLAFKYLYCELYVVTGRPIREVPFDYEFAAFDSPERPSLHEAMQGLRERVGGLASSALEASTEGRNTLMRLAAADDSPQVLDRTLHEMGGGELRRLRRYVGARARLARRGPRKAAERVQLTGAAIWRGLHGDGGEGADE
jgi:glycosyltransferase involved in cell wall biosynthesis